MTSVVVTLMAVASIAPRVVLAEMSAFDGALAALIAARAAACVVVARTARPVDVPTGFPESQSVYQSDQSSPEIGSLEARQKPSGLVVRGN